MRSVLGVHWQDWCWSWNSNTLAKWVSEKLTHWKRLWCWERLRAGGEGDNRGWDNQMASLTQWTWIWVNCRSWWWTRRPGMLWLMGLQRVGLDWATELYWTELLSSAFHAFISFSSFSMHWAPTEFSMEIQNLRSHPWAVKTVCYVLGCWTTQGRESPITGGCREMTWMGPENFPKMRTLRITSLMGQARSRKTQKDKCIASILKELKLNTGGSISLQNSRIAYISTTGKVLREGSHFSFFLDELDYQIFLFFH